MAVVDNNPAPPGATGGTVIMATHRFTPAVAPADSSPPPVHLTLEQWRDVLVSLRRRGAHVRGFSGSLGDLIARIEAQIGRGEGEC